MDNVDWSEAVRDLFSKKESLPERRVWTFYDDIVYSLRSMSSQTRCEIFWADTGGSILESVSESTERGCIELLAGNGVCVVKPARLEFESFGEDLIEWSYLRLEAATLQPFLPTNHAGEVSEFVAEVFPGQYFHPDVLESRVIGFDTNGVEIMAPPDAHIVKRYLTGSFVLFSAASKYKLIDEYRGYHIGTTRDEFKTMIQTAAEKLK